MSKLTVLKKNQVDNLDIFKKYGTMAAISDFAICTGGYVSDKYTNEGNILKNRTGYYWVKTEDEYNDARVIDEDGVMSEPRFLKQNIGCRPVLPFSEISKNSSGIELNGEIEYGAYPQSIAINQKELKRLFEYNKLNVSNLPGPIIDPRKYNAYSHCKEVFKPKRLIRYEYNGESFVRVEVNSCFEGDYFKLSDGNKYKDGDYVWIKYEPLKWLHSEKDILAICKKIICTGNYLNELNYDNSSLLTNVYNYMDKYLIIDLSSINTYKK